MKRTDKGKARHAQTKLESSVVVEHEHNSPHTDRSLKHLIILAVLSAFTYVINRWIIMPQEWSPVFFRDYLGDILALPVYLPLSLYLSIKLEIVPGEFQLNPVHVLAAVILFSVIFEGIVPAIDATSTRDPLDIFAYLIGGLIAYAVEKRCHQKSKQCT
ncbi:MAG: hypothetical protein K9N35_05895 [Candidatus Marinimicrobia bacterium]|nr:hypothetical protein [Candidatus Neomarinimicrobiota bacterium]